jgi:hypothetical protein
MINMMMSLKYKRDLLQLLRSLSLTMKSKYQRLFVADISRLKTISSAILNSKRVRKVVFFASSSQKMFGINFTTRLTQMASASSNASFLVAKTLIQALVFMRFHQTHITLLHLYLLQSLRTTTRFKLMLVT